jgi:glycosyltransferase involved in cell wall biosynthesis
MSNPSPSAVRGRFRFGFVIEYAVGHVTFANQLQEAVAADPDVDAEWFLLRSGKEGWVERLPPFDRNVTLQMSLRARRQVGRRRHELDAVLIHTQTAALFSSGLMRRLPTVISTDGTPGNIDELSLAYQHQVGSSVVEGVKRRMTGGVLRRAALVVPWSEWTARSVIEDYRVPESRVRLIRPGLYPERWAAKTVYGTDGRARFLFVGGDFRRKGGNTLLEALEEVSGDWLLDVVTKSKLADHSQIRVFNDLSPGDPKLAELYREADVFVLPTNGDTYGWAILEAMAVGLPVVSTSVGAIPEIVTEGETGYLIQPGDSIELAQVLGKLLASSELRRQLGEKARAMFVEEHNAHRNLSSVLDALKSACTRKA